MFPEIQADDTPVVDQDSELSDTESQPLITPAVNQSSKLSDIVLYNQKQARENPDSPSSFIEPANIDSLNCFQIKKILQETISYSGIYSKEKITPKMDEYNHWIETLTYKMVKNSPSFKLVNQAQCLNEGDFDANKLNAIKKQFNIAEGLDPDGLMRLYFTLKFLGQENSFSSAIKHEENKNSLLNYQLDINFDELKHIHVLRSLDEKATQNQFSRRRFNDIKEGKKLTCTSVFSPDLNSKLNSTFDSIVVDPHPVSAGHYIQDFWSEDFSFPKRDFAGKDVEKLRTFASGRHFATYQCHVLVNPDAHQHHFKQFGKCLTCIGSIIQPEIINPSELITVIPSNLDPRVTYQKKAYDDLFSKTEFGFVRRSERPIRSDDSILVSNDRSEFARIKSSNFASTYTESNIYLNFSDIKGLAKTGKSSEDFIDLFCETEFQRKQTLNSQKLKNEMEKIRWQRTIFCPDVKTDLEKKLAIFEKDLESLKSVNRESRGAVLKKYNSPIMGDAWTPCCGPGNEIYDENSRQLSMQERAKLVNPENINYFLQKEIYKAKSEIYYLSQLSKMPSEEQIKAKLSRDLELYKSDSSKTTLTEIFDSEKDVPDLKKLFLGDDAEISFEKNEKFKIFLERLAIEGFFNLTNISDKELQEKRKNTIVIFQTIANSIDEKITDPFHKIGNINEFQAAFLAKRTSQTIQHPSLPADPTPYEPFKYVPLGRSSLPQQLVMGGAENTDEKLEIAGLNYELKKAEIGQLLSPYRLQYSPEHIQDIFGNWRSVSQPKTSEHQLYYNEKFHLNSNQTVDLKELINHAFTDLHSTMIEYNRACERDKKQGDKGRDIHDGYHALTTSYYAKELLKFYQENKESFPQDMQTQIDEFDNPQKIRDLEILSIMHDSARYHGDHDQDEYKNAFYVALALRNMGDERFQGEKISEEGFQMVMDLANKESKEDKSLMSKLIQSADSLAILRCKRMRKGDSDYNFNYNEVFKDLSKITDEKLREKEKARLMVIGYLLLENEKNYEPPKFLEFSENPSDDFATNIKTEKLSEAFDYEKLSGAFVHNQDGFNLLLKAGCFKYILQNFSKDEINENFSKSKSYIEALKSWVVGSENFNDFVIKNSIKKINAGDLADLINLGIDIYSSSTSNKGPLAYQITKDDRLMVTSLNSKLLEYGVLIDENNSMNPNETLNEKNMREFCQKLKNGDGQILQQISQGLSQNVFSSKEDLHKKVQNLTFENQAGQEVSISLNGFGLLRILEQNLIQSPTPELSASLATLKNIRDSEVRQPNASQSQANFVTIAA